jgi:hypothetical protein
MFAHLAQKQAIEVLELNLRLLDAYEQTDIRFQEVISKPIAESQTALHKDIEQMLKATAAQINNALASVQEKINPYEPQDMRAVLDNQKHALKDLLTKNAILVTENSQLRSHISFMPVQYRDFAANLQATNSPIYLNQRADPKVIVPRSNHTTGGEIVLAGAPMSHPSVQEYLRDARYTSLTSAQAAMDRAFDNSDSQHMSGALSPPGQRSAPDHYAKGKRQLDGAGRGHLAKAQRTDPDQNRKKGKGKSFSTAHFPRFRNTYIPFIWKYAAQSHYDLYEYKPLPKKGVEFSREN